MNRIKVQYPEDKFLGTDSGQVRWLDPETGLLFFCKDSPQHVRNMRPTGNIGEWECCAGTGRRVQEVEPPTEVPEELPSLLSVQGTHGGLKHDGGKPRWSLLMRGCADALQAVVRVLTFGARKYADDSWQGVQNGQQRYRDALYRHLNAIERGELVDDESGESHWAHVATNALFLYELHKDQK